MKTLLIFLFIALGMPVLPQPRTDANLIGDVKDKRTGAHIPFVNVVIKGTTIGTTTDITGHYFLKNLPEGNYTVIASSMGYTRQEKEVFLRRGVTVELNFEIEEDAIMLDETVITASRNETNRREAPVVVGIISPMVFDNSNAVSLAGGLSFQPGIRVETNCQNCGFQQVRINGLDGPYTQILIDGKPVFSSLSGVYGIEQIPANMIERVEVIRGGGSALFGGSAIAGTINIITKEPVNNSFQVGHNLSLVRGKVPDHVTTLNGSMVSDDNKSGIHVFGMVRDRQPFDANDDGYSELTLAKSTTVGFRGYFRPTYYSRFTWEYHNINEFRRGGNAFDVQPHEADIAEQLDHRIHGGSLGYLWYSRDYKRRLNLFTSMQGVNRDSYYGIGQDLDAYGYASDLTSVSGLQYTLAFDKLLFLPADITLGSDFSYHALDERMPSYDRLIKEDVNVTSLFAQSDWKNKKMGFLLGARLDKHNLLQQPIFSPRVTARYNPIGDLSLRASYARGFRAPEIFDEDLHLSAAAGEIVLVQRADNLRTEHSHSLSTSADWYRSFGQVRFNLLVEGFYTRLSNVFILEDLGQNDEGYFVRERRNGDGAVVQGVNLEGTLVPGTRTRLQFGFTFQQGKYDEAVEWSSSDNAEPTREILRSPGRYGYFSATRQIARDLDMALTGTYTGPMLTPRFAGYIPDDQLKTTASFLDMNIKISYRVKLSTANSILVSAGMNNVLDSYQKDFDKGFLRDAGYIYGPSLPRTYFVGIKLGNLF